MIKFLPLTPKSCHCNKARSALHNLVKGALNFKLGARVDIAGCLV